MNLQVVVQPVTELFEAVPLLCDVHIFTTTLRCTAVREHTHFAPATLVANYTASPDVRELWHMHRLKLVHRGSWFYRLVNRWHIIIGEITELSDKLLSEVE